MLRISSAANTAGIVRHMSRTSSDIESSLKELSTGSRLETSPSKSSDRAIAETLKSQISGYEAAQRNTEIASSFIQVTEGSLNEQNNILIRMRELAVQSAGDAYNDNLREYADLEFQQLIKEFDRIAQTSKNLDSPSLNGEKRSFTFQVGVHSGSENQIDVSTKIDTTAGGVGIKGLSVEDSDDAQDALEDIDDALREVGRGRAELGAVQMRLDTADSHLQSQVVNLKDSYSKYADSDIATAMSKLRTAQVVQQYQIAALRASNETESLGIKLVA